MLDRETVLECCKLNLMGESCQNLEDQNADKKAAGKDQAHEVSVGNNDFIGKWTTDHVCYAMVGNLCIVYSSPETLQEIEIKGGRLINLVEEILRPPNVEDVAWVLLGAFSQL